MKIVGKVLWWSERDENGIVVDLHGNEFYFDRSVLKLRHRQDVEDGSIVTFEYNKSIKDCICAFNVEVPIASKRKHYEKKHKELAA